MTREEWARLKDVVAGALERAADAREAFVAAACGADAAMRLEVDSLLAASVHAADLYEHATLTVAGGPLRREALANFTLESRRFEGTDRYAVRRQIGIGGMGVVYEVLDRARGQVVALKTLRRWNAADIYRLKREFRSLAGIAHPNLASLYELVVDDRQCFFTMELVDGVTFVDYVRPSGSAATDFDRVRRALAQLIGGVQELHRRGKLHRDIKPSNVLVAADGRVVILDFGLTSNLAAVGDDEGVGTPAYMSPEQCRGAEATEASDWYSVGVTLYHALTGRVPFDGDMSDVIRRKTESDPPPPAAVASNVPDDLNELCLTLLHRDPGQRMAHRVDGLATTVFVGREQYLDALGAAFAAVKDGRGASVYIHGPSGIGKSALVQHFFDVRLHRESVLALRGRCHEHESVPYKGLDGVVDALSRHLAGLPREEAARLMPDDAGALARLFPVMQIEAAAGAVPDALAADPVLLRRRAFLALRELLRRVADRQPLVVEIDDFHWADVDSAASLVELLRPPDPPALLLILSFRSEEIESKPFLRTLMERVDPGTRIALPLAPLTTGETDRLIAALVPRGGGDANTRLEIAREAGGNPFLVEELARSVGSGLSNLVGAFGELLARRLDALPEGSRAFLETLAVCGRPILPARVYEACGLTGDERPLVARLRAEHFLRSSRSADRIEMYHDRIRETLAAAIPADGARQIHELMARILVAHGDDDPEALFDHYRGAGRDAEAAVQAAAAAEKSSAVLAFDRAAAFYRHALDLQPESDGRPAWIAGLARALENAGRPAEAADACLDAARLAEDVARIEWLRKAAEQLLIGGHIDRGLRIVHSVLGAVGMRLPRGQRTALVSILLRRAQLRWRGLDFVARDESQIDKAALLRIDTCWSITTGLAMVDNIRTAAFHIQQLLIALDTGEPYRVARALALEAGFSALGGGPGIARSAALYERAKAMAEQVGHPHAIGLVAMARGIAFFLSGQWKQSTALCERALTLFRGECTGVNWEVALAQDFLLGSLLFRGELRDVSHTMPGLLQAVRERGNLYFETELRTRMNLVWLANDEPDDGERQANEAIGRWSGSGFYRQHYNHLLARVQTALYRGRARDAWRLMSEELPPLRRSLWLRVQFLRIETAFMHARCALAMAAEGRDVKRMRAIAEHEARRLERERIPWANALARLIRATLAHQSGDVETAVDRLAQTVDAFSRADMHLYEAVCRRRLAALVGGDRGRALEREAQDWMTAQTVRNPPAIARLIAPGFPG